MEDLKIINLRISGGLGNQLYQFSFAYYLLKKYKYDYIYIDINSLVTYNENWGLLLELIIDENKMKKFVKIKYSTIHKLRIAKCLPLIAKKIYKYGFISDTNSLLTLNNHIDMNNIFLDGYFETIADEINYKELLNDIINKNIYSDIPNDIAVINIRGGAYSLEGVKFNESQKYYLKAISSLPKNCKLHLITDDIDYSIKLLYNIKFDKIHNPDPLRNFQYIVSSKYKILSFSTFSIWGGILSNPNCTIYYHPNIMERKWK